MVGCISWPRVVSKQGDVTLSAHSLGTQRTSCPLVACLVQEVTPEHCLIFLKRSCLNVILDSPKVNVIFGLNSIGDSETAESIVSTNLVLISQLNWSLRHNVAVVLDSIDCKLKSVNLGEVARHKTCVGVLLFCACERVFFFWCLGRWLGLFFAFDLVRLNFNVDFVRFTRKKRSDGVKLS